MVNLYRMRILIRTERRLKEKYDEIFSGATRSTTVITGMPRATGNHSQVEDGAIDLAEVEAAYHAARESLENMRAELKELLPSLDDPDDSAVIEMRYINGHDPEEIPRMINMSRRSMFYHLAGAERKLMRMYPERVIK